MTIVFFLVEGVFVAAAVLALWRIIVGPTVYDRVMAMDVMLAVMMAALGVEMVYNQLTNTLPVMLVFALFAVAGPVSVARFLTRKDD